MKRLVYMIIPALICGMVFTSCDSKIEEIYKPIEEGIYSGTFMVEYFVDMREGWSSSGTTTLELKNGKYTYTSDVPPKLCSGNYSISNDRIIFDKDRRTEYPDLNNVPPYFDVNLWLNGEYDYTFDGKKLKFSVSKNEVGRYEYDFKKQ